VRRAGGNQSFDTPRRTAGCGSRGSRLPGQRHPRAPLSACPLSHPACRFRDDARALVADGYGAWDLVQLTAVAIDGLTLEHDGSPLTRLYRAGALIGEVKSSAYSLRFEPATGVSQLRKSTNGSPDMPLLDHVTSLRFEYFGRAEQPVVIDDAEPLRRRTSFGLLPPPMVSTTRSTRGRLARTATSSGPTASRFPVRQLCHR